MSLTETIIAFFLPLFDNVGYRIIFFTTLFETTPIFGMIVPGQTIAMLGGLFAKLGLLHLPLVYFLATAGALLGDCLSFALGKLYGHQFIHKFGKYMLLSHAHYQRTKQLISEHPHKTIIIGRFTPVTRALGPFVAGSLGIKFYKLLPSLMLGCIIWAATFVTLGYFFGHTYERLSQYIDYAGIILTGLLLWLIYKAIHIKVRKHWKKYHPKHH